MRKVIFFQIFLLCLISEASYAEFNTHLTSKNMPGAEFVAVKTKPGDTLSSLSARYLNDPKKAWIIAEFNDIETVTPDRILIIPSQLNNRGGIFLNGCQTVPVLAYHQFSKKSTSRMTVAEATFEAQMKYLKENGYRSITLDQFFDFLNYKNPIPKKSVLITIDDGWKSTYDIAVPILKKYSFSATLFIYSDFIGGQKALSWDQIRQLAEMGFDIQSQSKTHRNLAEQKKDESFNDYIANLEKEILHPQVLIKKKVGRDCRYLAYPYGSTNSLVRAMLKKHGYLGAFTVHRGSNPFFVNNYMVHRSTIYGDYDIDQFRKNLSVFKKIDLK